MALVVLYQQRSLRVFAVLSVLCGGDGDWASVVGDGIMCFVGPTRYVGC